MTTTTEQPVAALAEPQPSDPIPDLVELVINGNAISPTYWINYVLKTTIGYDPLTDTTNKIAGDWEALQKAGTAVGNMSDYLSDYSQAIKTAAREADASWDGNAAEAAKTYFDSVTSALATQVSKLKDISTTIDEFALSSYYSAQVVCGLLQEIFDNAIIAAIKYAAAATMAATGVGAAGSAATIASAAFELVTIIARWQDVLGKFTDWVFSAEGAAAVVLAGVAEVSSTALPAMSGGSYDHQGVA
ncbi:WXG100 family type VII secretion target [Nocardia rhizosphaerae]|uniref:WXG100 family type VII secretion target n=1 Tax=Nocardia rhizosphaerae TaxID=1691571 RepID=A0ABV8KZS9_9NOCA